MADSKTKSSKLTADYSFTCTNTDTENNQQANIQYNKICDLFVSRNWVDDCKVQQVDGKVTMIAHPRSMWGTLNMFLKMKKMKKELETTTDINRKFIF